MLHKATIAGLTMDPTSNTPIIILKVDQSDKAVPIWIGLLEATAIASALQNIEFERPMTHDLLKNLLEKLACQVTRVEVCDLRDNTFYARIHCTTKAETFSIDSRPSDAIAIALRFQAPIFLDDRVIEKSATNSEGGEAQDKSEEGRKWAEYLKNLSPEHFGKYKV
jgi:bifunctional DNase/RNase